MNLLKLTVNNLQSMDDFLLSSSFSWNSISAEILIYDIRIHRQATFFQRLRD